MALFELGAHPFLTLTLFIAMFERDHGPLEYQKAYGAATGAPRPALPRHRHLSCAPPSCTRPARRRRSASTRRPSPAAGTTLVRVTAAPVVPLDLLCASGTSYFGVPGDCPTCPGCRGSASSSRPTLSGRDPRVVLRDRPGWQPGDGSMAELCSVPDADLVVLADDVPTPWSRRSGCPAVAAWMALTWRGGLQPGERVLVLGGGGAVGQVGDRCGAGRSGRGRVVAVCRSERRAERARSRPAPTSSSPLADDVDAL